MMTRRRTLQGLLILMGLSGGLMAYRSVRSADQPQNPKPEPAIQMFAQPGVLGGEERYLTFVSTDKPIYRAEEKVYVRGVVLEAHNRTPLKENMKLAAQITIKGPKGDIVSQSMTNSQDSTLGFSWPVPAGQAGGEYTAEVSFPWTGQPTAKRKFEIRAYRAPRLKSQIEFIRDGYGPGDQVAASLKVERAEGGVPVGAKVTVQARVDGRQVFQGPAVVDALGLCSARFELPKNIARGEGTLSFAIQDGGVVETAAKTIPILLQTVDLTMYPEGGELIAGLPNRVYLAALTPAQKPADIAGQIVDGSGKTVAHFRTQHEGRGRFAFTPEADEKYTLKINEPAGIRTTYPLPKAKAEGAVISSLEDATDAGEDIALNVGSTTSGKIKITLSQREKEIAAKTVDVAANKTVRVKLAAKDSAEGVLIATLWSADEKPLAERLVFRKPAKSLAISITPDKQQYVPGGLAKLNIKTTDSDGKPVSAVVGLTITDDSVQEMIEKREQAPRLPVMVFLEDEVKDLADAHVYLDPKNPKAPLAVDLLLGTQGWRRFAFLDTPTFLAQHGDQARTVLALTIPNRFRNRGFGGMGGGGVNAFQFAAPRAAALAVPDDAKNAPVNLQKAAALPANAKLPKGEAAPAKAKFEGKKLAREPVADQKALRDEVREIPPARRQLQQALERNKEQAEKRDFRAGGRAFDASQMMVANMVVVREYAHQLRPGRQPGQRRDFTETLYWNAGIKTDPKTGEAGVTFAMSDAVTSFRVMADAFDRTGTLGETTQQLESVEPFYTEPKLPLEVTQNDVIRLPISLVNSTSHPLSNGSLSVKAKGLAGLDGQPFELTANGRRRIVLPLEVGQFIGETDVMLMANAGPYADQVTRKLKVLPLGFPVEIARAGTLDGDDQKQHEITIPQTIIAGSLSTKIAVYPTPMASMTGAWKV